MKIKDLTQTAVATTHISQMPLCAISDLTKILDPAIYQVDMPNLKVSTAFYPKVRSDVLYVFFSGFVNRKLLTLPVFRRWAWHTMVPGHALYISDPTLEACEDLGLGWYIGGKSSDCMEDIAKLISSVALNFGISERNLVFYGSSGGGFAALRALRWFPDAAAIAINPQTELTSFRRNALKDYLPRFFDAISKDEFARTYPERNSLVDALAECRDSSVVYVQNTLDEHHMSCHIGAFYENHEGVWASTFFANQELVLFEDPGGHDAAEPKSMLPKLIAAAARLQSKRFG